MKLSTVVTSVNENPHYYMFIPAQIQFWKHFGIRFLTVYVGEFIPKILEPYASHIVLWNKNLDLHTSFVGQNLRIYYPALLRDIPEDEVVLITDIDMLPLNLSYFTEGLESFSTKDFIYYRHIDQNQIYMMYNAAHPSTWAFLFGIHEETDIETRLYETYAQHYDGIPGGKGWYTDQLLLYQYLSHYPHLHILHRHPKRLEVWDFKRHLAQGDTCFVNQYDDYHAHRDFFKNEQDIWNALHQLQTLSKN